RETVSRSRAVARRARAAAGDSVEAPLADHQSAARPQLQRLDQHLAHRRGEAAAHRPEVESLVDRRDRRGGTLSLEIDVQLRVSQRNVDDAVRVPPPSSGLTAKTSGIAIPGNSRVVLP